MSISAKKINSMIEAVFSDEKSGFSENQTLLIRLAKDIYAMESSVDNESNQNKIADIKSKVSIRSDEFKII